ncbi:ribosome assembly RNA-binding protein YhbY [Liquorilactobacillus oeni]|uniref:CRM domain-containing protein n=1 Tax=Liquorilactobacillus oeni DSM 19972 TaxID=1423777 RepID=A0A0R1M933_9LACO|nr:ribosome assembly RNA-binding protein YhbY [Liquorilactobacillus oeni]KRL04743.1 hypothetical protein FD46_GL001880 [Liquorilactobacillus oeni DSM 19972]
MLTGKQKRYLKAQAHGMRPIFQIGKEGLTGQWFKQVINALDKRELLKVNVLQGSLINTKDAGTYIANHSEITVVQVIGHVLVLYRKSEHVQNRNFSVELQKIVQIKE